MNPFFFELADFVKKRSQWIIETWLRAVSREPGVPPSDNLTRDQLIDHLPALCDNLGDRLRTAGRAAAPSESENARVHGVHRWRQGYRLRDLIREAELVRRVIAVDLLDAFAKENEGFDQSARVESERVIARFFTDMLIGSADQFAEEKEKAVKRWEQSSQAILDSALDCIIVIGENGRVEEWNPAAERLFGYTRSEVLGREIAELIIPPEWREPYRQELARFIATGEGALVGRRAEASLLHADGTRLSVELAIAAHRIDDAWGFTAYVRDITLRKANEAASQRLAAIVESSGDAILAMDLDGVITNWNAGAERLFGYGAGEIVGQPITLTIPSDLQAQEPQILERIRRGELIEQYQTIRQCKDGKLVHVSLTVSPIRDRAGNVIGASKIVRDISERVQSDARRAAEYEIAALTSRDDPFAEIAPQILAALASTSRWVFGALWFRQENGGVVCERTWRSADGPVANFEQITREQVFASGEGLPSRVIASGQPMWIGKVQTERNFPRRPAAKAAGLQSAFIFPLVAPSGTFGAIELFSAETLACDEGLLAIARVLGTQVALYIERKRTEDELRRQKEAAEAANQAKDKFLAALSHELRTPLNPVLMWACAALDDEELSESVREGLQMVCRNIELEARLIDDLLDLTRIARGKLKLDRQPRDANALLKHAVEIVRSQFSGKKLQLAVYLKARNHVVNADATRLQQVFWNLLKNACQFTPEGGEIEIYTYDAAPATFCLQISDTGTGIDADLMPKLFTAFEQGRITSGEGLGLGLAICRGIIEMHGGTLSGANRTDGPGATFTVRLNTVAEMDESERAGPGPTPTGSRKLRILVVEDHVETANVLRKLLERAGHDTIVAMNVRQALAALGSTEVDLLLSDLGLPDGSGFDLMRELARTSSAKGIAVSGYGMEEDVRRSREAGFSAHLTKPINAQNLTRTIREVTESQTLDAS